MVWYGMAVQCKFLGINNVNRSMSGFETRVKYKINEKRSNLWLTELTEQAELCLSQAKQ